MKRNDAEGTGTRCVVRRADDVAFREVDAGAVTRTQILIGEDDGAPNFAMRRFSMEAGGGMPRHTNTVEHEQFVLKGKARIAVGDRVHEVGPGTVLLIPAGVPHSYEVTEGPFEFLCMVPHGLDRIEILDP